MTPWFCVGAFAGCIFTLGLNSLFDWYVHRDIKPAKSIRCADSKAVPRAWTVRR